MKGTVVYPDSKKTAPGAYVLFWPVDWDRPINGRIPGAFSDADGKFSRELQVGRWRACPSKIEENHLWPGLMPFGLSVGGNCENVSVSKDQPNIVDLTLAPAAGSLHGRITNWKDITLTKDTVVIVYRPLKYHTDKGSRSVTSLKEATWDARVEAQVDKDGTFLINGLPEGEYFLRIEIPGQNPWFYMKESERNPSAIKIKNATINEVEFPYY